MKQSLGDSVDSHFVLFMSTRRRTVSYHGLAGKDKLLTIFSFNTSLFAELNLLDDKKLLENFF